MKTLVAFTFAAAMALPLLPLEASAATGFLKGERDEGLSKICFYDVLGEMHTLNMPSTRLCPLNYQFDIMPEVPAQPSYNSYGGKTGFLQGEREQGLSKICFYDVLGETQAITISSVRLCPLNHKF